MTNLTKEDMQEVLESVMNSRRTIDNETHQNHHDFIAMQVQKYHDRKAMWERFRLSFVGTIATGIVAGLYWVGKLIFDAFHRGPPQ